MPRRNAPYPLEFRQQMIELVPVTLGNIVGGSGLVALTYWLVYLRHSDEA